MVEPQSVSPSSGFRITPQLIVGLLIIFVGVVFTLDELGIAPAVQLFALLADGAHRHRRAQDAAGQGRRRRVRRAAVHARGVWLQAEELDIIHIRLWQIWPLALVLFGGFLVWQGLAAARHATRDAPLARPTLPASDGARVISARRASPTPTPRLSAMAILGGVSRGNNSRAFRGADLLAIMGGCQLDLRQAAINGEAVIDVFAMWGGIEIRVPEDWTVVSQIVPLMGGVEDKTRPPQGATAHRLMLRGFAIMGGVEIKN